MRNKFTIEETYTVVEPKRSAADIELELMCEEAERAEKASMVFVALSLGFILLLSGGILIAKLVL